MSSIVNLEQNIKIALKLNEEKIILSIQTDLADNTINSVTIQENDFSGKIIYTSPSDFPQMSEGYRPLGLMRHSSTLAFTFNATAPINCATDPDNSTSVLNLNLSDTANGKYIFSDIIAGGQYTLSITNA